MDSREGLIDTAVKTYETGAFFGGHYGVVRNSLGDVIQISELLESVAMLSKQKLKDRSQLGREIGGTNGNSWLLSVNLKRLIWNTQKTFKIGLRRASDMHPKEIVEAIDKLQIEFHFRQSLVEPRKWLD
ncbi:hypothetical protein TB1_026250 [Malus domestica]